MSIQDTDHSIRKVVINGCRGLAEHINITFSDAILNKVYEIIARSPYNGLVQSLQNLLDRSIYNSELQRFETENDECPDCVQTLIVTIEIAFLDTLRELDIVDIEVYQGMMDESPQYNWACFEDALFMCQGDTCNRDHSPRSIGIV